MANGRRWRSTRWSRRSALVLADAQRQGLVSRNVAEFVDRVPESHKNVDTYSETEVRTLLAAITDHRLAHAWELALSGLRHGETPGCDGPTSTSR